MIKGWVVQYDYGEFDGEHIVAPRNARNFFLYDNKKDAEYEMKSIGEKPIYTIRKVRILFEDEWEFK